MTQAARGTYFVAPRPGASTGGTVSYYVYDGSDVALVLTRAAATANSWWVRQRQLTGGVDQVLAGRYSPTGLQWQNLALVANREGSTVASVKPDGNEEIGAFYPGRNAFGWFDGTPATSGNNTETGFTGASTRLKSRLGTPWLHHGSTPDHIPIKCSLRGGATPCRAAISIATTRRLGGS